jgi:hypothetical protein
MKKKELQAIAQAAAKNIKTEEDLNEFPQASRGHTERRAKSAEDWR